MYISMEPEHDKYITYYIYISILHIVISYKAYHWEIWMKQKIQGYFPSQKCQNKIIHSVFTL